MSACNPTVDTKVSLIIGFLFMENEHKLKNDSQEALTLTCYKWILVVSWGTQLIFYGRHLKDKK